MKNDFVMFVPDDQIFYKKTKYQKRPSINFRK